MAAPIRLLLEEEEGAGEGRGGDTEAAAVEALRQLAGRLQIDLDPGLCLELSRRQPSELAAALGLDLPALAAAAEALAAGPLPGFMDESSEPEADARVREMRTGEEAEAYSLECCRAHLSEFTQGKRTLEPAAYAELERVAHALGRAPPCGRAASLLLPCGVSLHYKLWGAEAAPPLVLLHDVGEAADEWDELAPRLAGAHRVIAPHLRGHGASSHSPRRQYAAEALVDDLHCLVVELGLNGVDAHGATTRPWHLVGRGLGAAVGAAYASRYRGRVRALTLIEYDPAWPKDRLCFSRFQAARFPLAASLAAMLDETLGLGGEPERVARALLRRAAPVDGDEREGWAFKMDKAFFLSGHEEAAAWAELRRAAACCHVQWLAEERAAGVRLTRGRLDELAAALRAADPPPLPVRVGVVRRGGLAAEAQGAAELLASFGALTDGDAARRERRERLAAPRAAAVGAGGVVVREAVAEELEELRQRGEDLKSLAALGKKDRGALKALLKEMGFKGLRQRVKIEEALLAM
ncbi:hypothetical protein AB1Y20_002445 [Prymnesium parvum]|uniref:AB hydrolase-1 domain-containing protein n=1 Tax=Prymnesium parvum TaxID=97485 RepID=A0AB34JBD2_PRYPA